jgi:transcription termination/antitermination protein NusG
VAELHVITHEWFAVQVTAGRERLSARHLQVRGYDVFLPCYYEHRRWSDRIKKVETPLFVGYVFCLIGGDIVGKLVTTPGVIRIVGDGQRPLAVPREEIDSIRRVVDAQLRAEPWEFLQVGQRVRVGLGPLRGTEGIVIRVQNRNRLIISVAVLQRSVAVEMDPSWVCVRPEFIRASRLAESNRLCTLPH